MLGGAVFAVAVLWMAAWLNDAPQLASPQLLFTMVLFGGLGIQASDRMLVTLVNLGYGLITAKLVGLFMYFLWVVVGFLAIKYGPLTAAATS